MLRRLGCKALLPASTPAARRRFSEVASNFSFANAGAEGLKSSRCNAEAKHSGISPLKRVFDKQKWGLKHTVMASSKQALTFPRHEVVENRRSSLPTCVEADDDFAELGPSLPQHAKLGSDLVKENRKGTMIPGLSLDGESKQATHVPDFPRRRSDAGFFLKQDNYRPGINLSPVNQNDVPRTLHESEKQNHAAEIDLNNTSLSISIDKVPPNISLQNLREAVSLYGEILTASLRTGPDKLTSCIVKFKDIESKDKALKAQWITVMNCRLPVHSLQPPEYMTIRISNISMDTAEPAIHSMCMSCGEVAGLARTKEGFVDVLFRVKSNYAAENIVKRLSDVYYDDCKWSAHLLPKLGQNSKAKASDSQWLVGSQISDHLETFRKQFQMQRIYLEDLEDMHYAVLHLRDRPTDLQPQNCES